MAKHGFTYYPALSDDERGQSLQELEMQDWGEAPFPSYLVRTCHALRRKPLRDFTVEDLRIMIGQNISLDYLIPLALEHLQQDPLVAGDFFPGDLLANVLKVKADFWHVHPHLRQVVQEIVEQLQPFPEDLDQDLQIFQQG
ncbi:MAG TPA: contact-dependent growth inhibition system immunity protein, partial [Ktedonobacteraceae bacterium]|nr:contact-dependent growth inhibition system immunity protein [Ktedonobacteraceae bacterium]